MDAETLRLAVDTAKVFMDFAASMVGHLAWPIAVVSLLLIFRKAILKRFGPVTKATIGNKVVFEFLRSELQEKVPRKLKFNEITEKTLDWDKYLDLVEQWGVCASLYAIALVTKDPMQPLDKDDHKWLLKMIQHTKMCIKKLKQERPDSEFLDMLHKTLDMLLDALKVRKEYETKASWSANL